MKKKKRDIIPALSSAMSDWINKEKQEKAKGKLQSDIFNAHFITLVNKDYFAYVLYFSCCINS